MGRVKLSVENELATELGHDRDAMLRALAERSGVEAYLRGNELTLDGDDDAVERARSVMDELAQLVAEGVSVGPPPALDPERQDRVVRLARSFTLVTAAHGVPFVDLTAALAGTA